MKSRYMVAIYKVNTGFLLFYTKKITVFRALLKSNSKPIFTKLSLILQKLKAVILAQNLV
jgi:hypothetical protein